MATVLAAEISNKTVSVINPKLKVSKVVFWCDSQVASHWIQGKGSSDGFVKRRVELIKKLAQDRVWYYCPSKMNPADAISRGTTVNDLIKSNWVEGPGWLRNKDHWPHCKEFIPPTETPPMQSNLPTDVVMQKSATSITEKSIYVVIQLERFSSLNRLLMVTAVVMRFIYNCRSAINKRELKKGDINADEKDAAMKNWIKFVQAQISKI